MDSALNPSNNNTSLVNDEQDLSAVRRSSHRRRGSQGNIEKAVATS
jgi:hypothetical protein